MNNGLNTGIQKLFLRSAFCTFNKETVLANKDQDARGLQAMNLTKCSSRDLKGVAQGDITCTGPIIEGTAGSILQASAPSNREGGYIGTQQLVWSM